MSAEESKSAESENLCENINCTKPASLKCPNCLKLKLSCGYFCGQDCFKQSWKWHKHIHNEEGKLPSEHPNLPSFNWTGPLRPGIVLPTRAIPEHIPRPEYAESGESALERAGRKGPIDCKTPEQLADLRECCKLAREVLDIGGHAVKPGVTTDEIDRICHEACIERGAYPSPSNYYWFPKSICTSVNEIICHGIPDSRELQDGDIVNLDITLYYKGMHGDLNETFCVGKNVDKKAKNLIKTTYESLEKAISIVKPGTMYRDVGKVISKHCSTQKYSVVKSYCGHGIGNLFHTTPNIPHYHPNKAVGIMKAGHSFTIEPMVAMGSWRDVTWPDQWTSATEDGKLTAQFEHTMVVTDTGVEVLTARVKGQSVPLWWEEEVAESSTEPTTSK